MNETSKKNLDKLLKGAKKNTNWKKEGAMSKFKILTALMYTFIKLLFIAGMILLPMLIPVYNSDAVKVIHVTIWFIGLLNVGFLAVQDIRDYF